MPAEIDRPASLSALPVRRFWGWGYQHEQLSAPERQAIHGLVGLLGGNASGGGGRKSGGGIASMLDLDGDGNPLDDIMGMLGKLRG